jgi:hydroxyacylglutathione hydrolase
VRITHVTETHIHADFASGARELARAAGATLHVSDEGGDGWRYAFAQEEGVNTLHDGDRITVGNVHLDVLHTPGHTPEHLTFLVTDGARTKAPVGALTGDFVFVGDVGRPDLLERAAGQTGTMRNAAAELYQSVQRFKSYPDYLQIWPGHGAGSACGKAMSAAAQSTLGYEKVANWAFEPMSETEFVERVLEGQPTAPPYFGAMKVRNRDGVSLGPSSTLPRKLSVEELHQLVDARQHTQQHTPGANHAPFLLDVRNPDEWARGHIEGATLIPLPELHSRLHEVPRDRPVIVHCQRGGRSAAAAATLDAAGFSDVHDVTGGYATWEAAGFPTAS